MSNDKPFLNLDEPTPTKKKHHTVLILGAGLVVLAIICGVAALGNSRSKHTTLPTPTRPVATPTPAAKPTPTLGQPVRDGKFEFTVNKIDCNHTHLGDTIMGSTAQGKYCLINMTVKNIGSDPQILTGGWQEAYSADGKKFTDDAAAELYANNNDDPLLATINPGNTVTGNLVYDVSPDTMLTKMKLHDSPFSGGVWVAILG